MAKTLAGSAMATTRRPSSWPIGIAVCRRAHVPGTRARAGAVDLDVGEVDEAHADLGGQRGDQLGSVRTPWSTSTRPRLPGQFC